jgi:hypothetical protein
MTITVRASSTLTMLGSRTEIFLAIYIHVVADNFLDATAGGYRGSDDSDHAGSGY